MRATADPLDWLARFDHSLIKPGLERIHRILDGWGRPQEALRAVHLAGTNGKGSTAAMVASMLQAAGYRVGLYTSPHLHTVRERMRIDGEPIGEPLLAELADELRVLLHRLNASSWPESPTYFECTTAIAFAHFARASVDWAVIETGLGGRFDATNVVRPSATLLTPIDYDHQHVLGRTLTSIAWEKAGICKPGAPVIVAPQPPEAMRVIEREAGLVNAPMIRCGVEFSYDATADGRAVYRDGRRTLTLTSPLPGRHQLMNAAMATAAVLHLRDAGAKITDAQLAAGLAAVRWEGRLERLQERPAVWLDGAHNPAAARVLAEFLAEEKARRGGSLTVIFGIMRDKAAADVVAALRPVADRWIVTAPETPRALPVEQLADIVRGAGVSPAVIADPALALADTLPRLSDRDLCCVTGSFYTVAAARAWWAGSHHRPTGSLVAAEPSGA